MLLKTGYTLDVWVVFPLWNYMTNLNPMLTSVTLTSRAFTTSPRKVTAMVLIVLLQHLTPPPTMKGSIFVSEAIYSMLSSTHAVLKRSEFKLVLVYKCHMIYCHYKNTWCTSTITAVNHLTTVNWRCTPFIEQEQLKCILITPSPVSSSSSGF